MSLNIDKAFIEEKNKVENFPIYLFEIEDFDGAGNILRFCKYQENVTWNGNLYISEDVSFSGVSKNIQGVVDSSSLQIQNVNRGIQGYINAHSWIGKIVNIIQIWFHHISDPNNFKKEAMRIEAYNSNEMYVSFTLISKFDVTKVKVPKRRFFRSFCEWHRDFKGDDCGYAGTETCDGTWDRCKELSNTDNFGGFPSIPVEETY